MEQCWTQSKGAREPRHLESERRFVPEFPHTTQVQLRDLRISQNRESVASLGFQAHLRAAIEVFERRQRPAERHRACYSGAFGNTAAFGTSVPLKAEGRLSPTIAWIGLDPGAGHVGRDTGATEGPTLRVTGEVCI